MSSANLKTPIANTGRNPGLPSQLQSRTASTSGHSLDNVRVHNNSVAPSQLNNHAYAQGNRPSVSPGVANTLAHERSHVVQQQQGNVAANTNSSPREAVVGRRATHGAAMK